MLRQKQDALSAHDHCAMRVYNLLAGAAVERFQLTPLVFDILGLRLTQDEALLLLEKLNVIEQDRRDYAPVTTEDTDG